MLLRFDTGLTSEDYVRREAWRDARLPYCPSHRQGGCSLMRHGTYERNLINVPPVSPGISAQLQAKSAKDYTTPGSKRRRVAAETLRDWLKRYRRGGFDALLPRSRSDRGQPRRLPDTTAEALIALKEQYPKLSVRLLIDRARERGAVPSDQVLPTSTIYRLLQREGLMVKKTDSPTGIDRQRFASRHAGELWMSDVMHGITVGDGAGKRRKSCLIAFLDDATRVIPYAAFAFSENTAAFPNGFTSKTAPTTAPATSPWSAPNWAWR